jgi:hypothetical protein
MVACAVCEGAAHHFATVDGYPFLECEVCDSIAVDAATMEQVDRGALVRRYDEDYWSAELSAARSRSWGEALARVGEVVLYCERPIQVFLDIATGPGYLLDALATYLPSRPIFHGVELFPPPEHSAHPNYLVGSVADFPMIVDAGVCIETIEHLTPRMARDLAEQLGAKCQPNSLILFNTGLSDFTRNEDPGYIDPVRRGHIISWGLPALRSTFEPAGFKVHPLRSWAFAIEYRPTTDRPLADRIWNSPNAHLLSDPEMGSVMFILGRESARTYNERR